MQFALDVCEFLRVVDDTNGPNALSVYFNGQYCKGSITGARDERRLTIDFCQLNVKGASGTRSKSIRCNCANGNVSSASLAASMLALSNINTTLPGSLARV